MPQPHGDQAKLADCYASGLQDPFPKLGEDTECQTLIVGAGVTGTSAAHTLAKSGADVILIDETEPGAGGSGRAFGQVVAFGKHSESWYRKKYGAERGQRVIDWLATGPDVVFDLIDHYDIECAARRTGLFFAAHHPRAEVGLRDRAAYWAGRGHAVTITEAEETRALTGSPFYDLALWDKRAGSINPLAFTKGLAVAAFQEGARIFKDTPATGIRREGDGWRVTTPRGVIRAKTVGICTNAYSGNLWPSLRRSVVPVRSYQLVSKPVSDNLRSSLLPGGQSITDTRRTFSAVRLFDDGRLHLSVNGPTTNISGKADAANGTQRIADLFPQLGDVAWDESWSGWVGVNLEQEPRLSQLAKGLFGVAGFSGRGLAYGTLMGREIALRLQDPDHHDAVFPVRPVGPLPGHSFGPAVVAQMLRYYSFLDDRELRVLRQKTKGLPT